MTDVQPGWRRRELVTYLRSVRGSAVHIIDPFKLTDKEVAERAAAAGQLGAPWIILASTDCPNFEQRMAHLVPMVRHAVSVPVLLHFPPTRGRGLPVVAGADGYLCPALLTSEDPYFVWESLLESAALWPRALRGAKGPEPILCAALTVGPDAKSASILGTREFEESDSAVSNMAQLVQMLGLDMVYLFARHQKVRPETCAMFREQLSSEHLIFVSGNMRSADDVEKYLSSGADFVGFASACEGADWRERMPEFFLQSNGVA